MSGIFIQSRYSDRYVRISNNSVGLLGENIVPTTVEGVYGIIENSKLVGIHIDFNYEIVVKDALDCIANCLDFSKSEALCLRDFLIYSHVNKANDICFH